jgi:hypothetical protein
MNHRIGRIVFSLAVGLAIAAVSYRWVTNPEPRVERAREETVVQVSRSLLAPVVASDELDIVDPLAPNRKVGKVYVYAEGPGWAVSGYYRRDESDRWHPYLMTLTKDLKLVRLKVQDAELAGQAAANPALEIRP